MTPMTPKPPRTSRTSVLALVNRRVLLAILLLVVGIVTNAWHKNPISGAVIVLTVIALAVWYGDTLSTDSKGDAP